MTNLPPPPPAGWYPDGAGGQRYWDGQAWTEHTAPLAPALPAGQPTQVVEGARPLTLTAPATATVKKAPGKGAKIAAAAVMALLVLAVASVIAGSADDELDQEELSYGAFDVCTEFVKDRLKAPGTAVFRNFFEDDGEVVVRGVGNGPYSVNSTVDAENEFGALIRIGFTCTVNLTEDGETWRLQDITLDE